MSCKLLFCRWAAKGGGKSQATSGGLKRKQPGGQENILGSGEPKSGTSTQTSVQVPC